MPLDTHPIPWEKLPPEWGPTEYDDGRFAYHHDRFSIVLVANRTEAAKSHPGFGLCGYWELRYRYLLGDRAVSEAIARVSTRSAAVSGLLKCMNRVHDSVERPTDPIEVMETLRDISFSDFVPENRSTPG
ncbi:hypothetical protein [Natrialba asiatica]|uniref:Uncharacterized protein n=1 Tax=Natrialba asiatica (strain ATCC 700177 / DSM 12278 / JCM 9576 / FERM P-10747 / NBRC 102637 / 172P1) TaxID=29540 RepID=M0AI77_NATA1|nr:hypothetical protein [Natrialba asiatica]ELY98046.1 hypothetical protein C481_18960 [Natrialba asiatica DSM 12278]